MSTKKRSLSSEDDWESPEKLSEELTTPTDSPQSKKRRHSSSHSENEQQTQILDEENGRINDQSTDLSSSDENENDDEENEKETLISVPFDNGENDEFRYDGTVLCHIRLPHQRRQFELYSESTFIRTFTWRIFVRQSISEDKFSVYIEPKPKILANNWSIFATAEITLIHPKDSKKNWTRILHRTFTFRTKDWGFRDFISIKDLYRDFIHLPDRTIRLQAIIHADPPRNAEWNSKEQTGYVGLRNNGATCYMNSFLQTIYFTKKLRKAVYALPTDGDDLLHSMSLALQKVFYDLQFGEQTVFTKKLTRSFGWDKPDEFCQHDIQEFCRILLDKLESKMEGTTMEGIIPSLFQGQYVQYVRCRNVDYESRVQQPFYDVPLQVRNSANVTESFRDFCKSEILTGDNLYDAGSVHGLQEAEKGVKFEKFPPVLCLHLLRFEYDYQLGQHRKLNNTYSFDYRLDLNEFLEKPHCSPCSYKLLSILVHSGDNSSGHYVSFINPELDGRWFKFDDEIVGHVAAKDAMDRNFGGIETDDYSTFNTSAYMLFYIREDCQDDVLCSIRKDEIPKNLRRRFAEEKKTNGKIHSNTNDLIDVKVILNDDFANQSVTCLADLLYTKSNGVTKKSFPLRSIYALKSEKVEDFAQRLIRQLGVNSLSDIRIWIPGTHEMTVQHSTTHFYSPTIYVPMLFFCDDFDKKLIDVFHHDRFDGFKFFVFVEQKRFLDGIFRLISFNKDDDVLIFVRLFNARYESLLYIDHFLFSKQKPLQICLKEISIRSRLSISSTSSFIVHQGLTKFNHSTQYESIDSANFDLPLSQALDPCLSGCSLIVQHIDPTAEIKNDEFVTIENFFTNRQNRQEFDVLNEDNFHNETLFKLFLPLKTPIKEVIRLISERIEYPAEQILLQRSQTSLTSANGISATSPFHLASELTLKSLFGNTRDQISSPRRIFFKRLPFHYNELEQRRLFRISFANPLKNGTKREIQVYPRKTSTVGDFLNEIHQWIPFFPTDLTHRLLRIIELATVPQANLPFKLNICPNETKMSDLICSPNRIFYLEEMSIDDNDAQKESTLIPVAQYTKENNIQISTEKFYPFFLSIKHNETVEDVKQRLRNKLNLSTLEFGKYRFALCLAGKLLQRYDDNLVRINLRELTPHKDSCWLGLESPIVSNPRKTRKSVASEKPMRIN